MKTEAKWVQVGKMGDEEVEMVPTDNSEVLLESEAERSGGIWRGM